MAGHTPGPWSLETVKTSCGICHKVGPFPWKLGQHNHACIYVDYPNHDNRGLYEDELAANARLIAAAPELLAALLAAMTFIDSHVADPDITGEMATNYAALMAANPKAAIAKATGATP